MRTRHAAATIAAALGTAAALAFAGPAAADPANAPTLTVGEPGDCGTTTIATTWPTEAGHVANTALVVQAAGTQTVASIGESITVGPFDTAGATIRYRVWGGGERDYDQPELADLDALLDHLASGGTELDTDPPGVAWYERKVYGCPEPSPSPEPTQPSPTPEPSAPGQGGGGDDEGGLPVTGTPVAIIAGGAAALLTVGGGLYLVARRRRVSFTA